MNDEPFIKKTLEFHQGNCLVMLYILHTMLHILEGGMFFSLVQPTHHIVAIICKLILRESLGIRELE